MKAILFSVLLVTSFWSKAQINGPDTVQVNTPVTFSTTANATTYAWATGVVNAMPSTTSDSMFFSSSFNTATQPVMLVENGNYIGFVLIQSGDLLKLSYGLSPKNTPTVTSLGNFGVNNFNAQGLDIVFDNGSWQGLLTNGGDLIRLDFGSSLNNNPVATVMNFSATMWYPMQISIKRVSSTEIYAFAGHFGMNGILRFDFGDSLTKTPTVTTIASNNFNNPCNFSLFQERGTWYMLVSNLTNHTLSLVDFGSFLKNNNPTITNLGTFSGVISYPRTISILPDCNELYAIVANETGDLAKLDFNGSISNAPIATSYLTLPNANGLCNSFPYWYNDTLYTLLCSFGDYNLHTINLQSLPQNAVNSVGYGLDSFTTTFTTPGSYDLTVQVDQGFATGASTFCKTVVVEATVSASDIHKNSLQIYPNPASEFISINVENIEGKEAELVIFSALGNIIWKKNVRINNGVLSTTINVSTFPKGVYNLRVSTDSRTYSEKIVLQ